jgi:hypothetical protein
MAESFDFKIDKKKCVKILLEMPVGQDAGAHACIIDYSRSLDLNARSIHRSSSLS